MEGMRRGIVINYWIFLFENASYSLALSLISPASVLPLFFERLGASNTVIGMLPALASMGSLMAAAAAATWVEQARLKKFWLLKVGLAGRVLLIAPARIIAPIIGGAVFDYMGFAAMGWLCLAAGIVATAALKFLMAEPRRRGAMLG